MPHGVDLVERSAEDRHQEVVFGGVAHTVGVDTQGTGSRQLDIVGVVESLPIVYRSGFQSWYNIPIEPVAIDIVLGVGILRLADGVLGLQGVLVDQVAHNITPWDKEIGSNQ